MRGMPREKEQGNQDSLDETQTVNGVTNGNRVLGADHCMPPEKLLGVLRLATGSPNESVYSSGMRSKQTLVFTVAAWQGPWWLFTLSR